MIRKLTSGAAATVSRAAMRDARALCKTARAASGLTVQVDLADTAEAEALGEGAGQQLPTLAKELGQQRLAKARRLELARQVQRVVEQGWRQASAP